MNKMRQLKSRGSALALVMIALIILLITGVGLLSLGSRSRLFAIHNTSSIAARCAADAGLVKAFFEMNEKLKIKPWDDTLLPEAINESLPNSDASYSYKVSKDADGKYVIESIGVCNQSSKSVRCNLRLESPFDYAIFGSRYIWLKAGTTIDGYNYDSPGELLKIGVNSIEAGAIFARLGVLIDGDVFVGPGGDPSVVIDAKNEVVITGECFTLDEAHPLDPVPFPSYLAALPSLGTITTSITLTGNAKCDAIDLTGGAVLTINGPVSLYVVGQTKIDNSAQIKVVDANTNPDAYLNLYLGDIVTIQNSGALNNFGKDASKLKIYGLPSCPGFTFQTDSVLYGAVYAPSVNFNMLNKVVIYGSVIVERLTQQVDSDFHYDASLKNGSINDELVRFTVDKWSE